MPAVNSLRMKIVIFLAATLTLIGCASRQPISNYARSGDTVMVSLGGTNANALVSVLKKEKITVTLIDAANVIHPVKVRNVFRVYSDPTSAYSFSSISESLSPPEAAAPPHMGLWMAVIDLVDPNTGVAPAIAVGPGTLSVASPELMSWIDYFGVGLTWSNGNLKSIPIEILPGSGSPNPMNFMQAISFAPLNALEPSPHIEVTAGVPAGFGTIIGGGTFVFRYVTADFGAHAIQHPRVTTTAADQNVQLVSHYVDQADGTTLLTVMMANPYGFNPDNSRTGLVWGRSLLRSLRFDIMWRNPQKVIDDENWQSSINFVSGQYVDLNGNPLPQVVPVLAKVR